MSRIKIFNNISTSGLQRFPSDYQVGPDVEAPDAILLRSFDLHSIELPDSVRAVGRAGAGVNNIPVDALTNRGIVVFNTPGANANAVAELTLAGMLLAARNIVSGWDFARGLNDEQEALDVQVERGKKRFAGFELAGKTLGIIGLGAIGVKVANAASGLGLRVIGFDTSISVENAWQLLPSTIRATGLDMLLSEADIISLHIPLNDQTRVLIDAQRLKQVKTGATLINFSRAQVVDQCAVRDALDENRLHAYVSDFPSKELAGNARAITLPHLGASTAEAEENCARMIVDQVRDFLEHGNILHAVNLPDVYLPYNPGITRLAIVNENRPNILGQITTALASTKFNIANLNNKSKGDFAYTLIELDERAPDALLGQIRAISGVLSLRQL
jgi:D-3-phosphoglycerate dehydrogenase / 2-oxoglutarate reductase